MPCEPKRCGIYCILNTVNQKRYYGRATDWARRKTKHLSDLRLGRHPNFHLQAAWDLYGSGVFEFLWVEDVLPGQLDAVEQRYLDGNPDGYNIARISTAPMMGRKQTEEAKAKVRAAKLGKKTGPLSAEHRAKLSKAGMGVKRGPLPIEHRQALANIARNRSPETRARMSASQKGRKVSDAARIRLQTMWIGRKHSVATRKLMSIRAKARWQAKAAPSGFDLAALQADLGIL